MFDFFEFVIKDGKGFRLFYILFFEEMKLKLNIVQ